MFFMIGTWPGKKDLGNFEGYNVYMTFTSIVIFFIPLFKLGKQYFAVKNCRTFQIDPAVGRQLERGEDVPLQFTGEVKSEWNPSNSEWARNYNNPATDDSAPANAAATGTFAAATGFFAAANSGTSTTNSFSNDNRMKICMRCKYRTANEEFTHCPMCGNKLVHE